MMAAVVLFTRDRKIVGSVEIPHFEKLPEVLIWGDRVFVLQVDGRYVEGMAWVALGELLPVDEKIIEQ